MTNEITHTNLVLSVQWYVENGWYGENKRLILNGILDEGFQTEKEAKIFQSMFLKYAKSKYEKTIYYRNARTERSEPFKITLSKDNMKVALYKDLETYRYCSMGPSWSCANIVADTEDFLQFVDKEQKRLEEGKERRSHETRRREAMRHSPRNKRGMSTDERVQAIKTSANPRRELFNQISNILK